MLAETVLGRVITQLNEADPPVQWTRNELIASLNEARRLIVNLKPDAGAVTEGVKFAAGSRQTLPAGGSRFLKLPSLLHTTETSLKALGPSVFHSAQSEDIQAFALDDQRTLLLWRDLGAGGRGLACLAVRTGQRVRYTDAVEWGDGNVTVAVAVLDSGRVLVFWADANDGNQGKARVLAIEGELIFPGELQTVTTAQISHPAVCRLHNDVAVLAWRDDDDTGDCKAVVARVPCDYMQFGIAEEFSTNALTYLALASAGPLKAVVAYSDDDSAGRGAARVLSVDGYDITVGTETVFEAGDTTNLRLVRLTSGTLLAAYTDVGNSSQGTACALSVAGTTITAGTAAVFETGSTSHVGLVALSGNRAAVAYRDVGNSDYGTACAFSVATLTITAGTPVVFLTAATGYCWPAPAGDDNLFVAYQDGGNSSYGTGILLDLAALVLARIGATVFETGDPDNLVAVALDENHVLCCYADSDNSNYLSVVCLQVLDGVVTIGAVLQVAAAAVNAQSNPIALVPLSATVALVAYRNGSAAGVGMVAVLTISGTTVTAGTPVQFHATEVQWLAAARLTNNLALVFFRDEAVDDDAKMYPVTITAAAPTVPVVGTVATLFAGDSTGIQAVGFSATQALAVLLKEGQNSDLAAFPILMVGTLPTPGTALTIEASAQATPSLARINASRTLLAWKTGSAGNRVRAAVVWSNGSTAGAGTAVDVTDAPASYPRVTTFNAEFCGVGYRDEADGNAVKAVVLRRREMALEVAGDPLTVSATATVHAPLVAIAPNLAVLLHRGTTGIAYALERLEPEYAGDVLLSDLDMQDRRVPGWRNATPGDPTCFLVDPLDRLRYWVSPPVPKTGNTYGHLQYSRYPEDVPKDTDSPPYSATETEFGLDPQYEQPAEDWVLYRAFDKEDEIEVLGKAQTKLQSFIQGLGLESQGQLAGLAQVRAFPFTPAAPKPETVKT